MISDYYLNWKYVRHSDFSNSIIETDNHNYVKIYLKLVDAGIVYQNK